jgi:hypothetical protein
MKLEEKQGENVEEKGRTQKEKDKMGNIRVKYCKCKTRKN